MCVRLDVDGFFGSYFNVSNVQVIDYLLDGFYVTAWRSAESEDSELRRDDKQFLDNLRLQKKWFAFFFR